jgi:hypothetical protein
MNGFNLPRFRTALAKHAKTLPSGTFWRYSNGILPPPFGSLLVENPELAEALAADARELSEAGQSGGAIVAQRDAA